MSTPVVSNDYVISRRGKAAKGTKPVKLYGKATVIVNGIAKTFTYEHADNCDINALIEDASSRYSLAEMIMRGHDAMAKSDDIANESEARSIAQAIRAAGLAENVEQSNDVAKDFIGKRAKQVLDGFEPYTLEQLMAARSKVVERLKTAGNWKPVIGQLVPKTEEPATDTPVVDSPVVN
jgi:hypothetical protein